MTNWRRSRVGSDVESASANRVSEIDDRAAEAGAERAGRSEEARTAAALRPIFDRLAAGRREALGELYDLVAGRLYGLALWRTGDRADAEEVVQEVFVRLAERQGELDRVREPLAWLLTVTRRAAVDRVRRRRLRATEDLDRCELLVAPDTAPERALDAERASEALAALPPAQREVLYLRHFGGLSFAAIAAVVKAPLFTVASRHRLGLARLRKRFEEEPR